MSLYASPCPAQPQSVPKPGYFSIRASACRLQHTRPSKPNTIHLHSSVSSPQPPNSPAPATESEVSRYFLDNVFSRLAYPSGSGDSQERECLGRLERLDRETDQLAGIVTGAKAPATSPVMDPATFMYPASVMDLATETDSVTARDSATVTDRATATDRTIVTDPTIGTGSTASTNPADGTEPATNV